MKLSDYKNFIKLFPTENSGYKIKKQNWLGTNQAKLIEEIFDNKTEIILTKEKIKKETDLSFTLVLFLENFILRKNNEKVRSLFSFSFGFTIYYRL